MSTKEKFIKELKAIFWTTLYFLIWFGTFMILKIILLREYKVDFYGLTTVLVGALVAAKAVLILENIPLFKSKTQPAIVEILLRTLLYMAGIFILMVLEKSIETRHEYGGFMNAMKNLIGSEDGDHLLVNTICVFGALFFFNLGSVIKDHLGVGGFLKILTSPMPLKNKR